MTGLADARRWKASRGLRDQPSPVRPPAVAGVSRHGSALARLPGERVEALVDPSGDLQPRTPAPRAPTGRADECPGAEKGGPGTRLATMPPAARPAAAAAAKVAAAAEPRAGPEPSSLSSSTAPQLCQAFSSR